MHEMCHQLVPNDCLLMFSGDSGTEMQPNFLSSCIIISVSLGAKIILQLTYFSVMNNQNPVS